MRPIRTILAASAAALMLTGGVAFAQEIETPYSPLENEMAQLPDESKTPAAEVSGRGATLAPEAGGTVRIGGSSDGLVATPEPQHGNIDD